MPGLVGQFRNGVHLLDLSELGPVGELVVDGLGREVDFNIASLCVKTIIPSIS